VIRCPSCEKTFDVEADQIAGAGVRLFCDRCKTIFGLGNVTDKRALVIHGSDPMSDIVGQIVKDAGWVATRVKTGAEALTALKSDRFRLAVVDVATEAPYAFELVPALKQHEGMNVLLLASVYDKTAYKRRPNTLYGADMYLEQHHLPDKLPVVLASLDGGGGIDPGVDPETDVHRSAKNTTAVMQKREALRRAADEQLGNGGRLVTPGDMADLSQINDVSSRARALAKKLVLDISLYDEPAFLRGLSEGTLRKTLATQLHEAKRFLGERMPPPLGQKEADSFIERALDELCEGRRR
jgi:predicted Zn finger-like uncharacterized protein